MARKRSTRSRGYARSRVSRRTSRAPVRRRGRALSPRRGGGSSTLRIVVENAPQMAPVMGDPRIIPVTPGKARF